MVVYGASGLTSRPQARELLALAVTALFLFTQGRRYGYGG